MGEGLLLAVLIARVPHPELLDQDGQVIREPLLVMRSISMKDAREQLDALYDGNSPRFRRLRRYQSRH